jgi:N-acetylneuraminic acid mutarotase
VNSRAGWPLGLLLGVCAAGCNGSVAGGGGLPGGADAGPDGHAAASTGHWEGLADMPGTPRYYVGVAALGERVFVVGGFGAGPQSMAVTAYDTTKGSWQTLQPLPGSFQMPNVAAVNGTLYVLGGLEQKMTLAYDAAHDQWQPRSAVPVERGRGQSAVGVWGTKILIAGGVIPGQSANGLNTGMRQHEVLAYDTATDSWEPLPDLALTRGYCMGAVIGDHFWVMGGSSDFARTDDVTVLDLNARTWTDQPALPITLSSAGVAVLGDRVYLVGGVATGSGTIGPATLVLDPVWGVFDQAAVMITPRFGMGAAAIGARIYVPAGIAASAGMMFAPVPTMEVFIP